jgi:hypothetical protein
MLKKLGAAVVAGLAIAAVSAAPAHAASYTCDAHSVCLWQDITYGGQRQEVSGYSQYTDLNASLHDQASSWGSSNGSQVMCVINWVGGSFEILATLNPGNRTPWVGPTINDKADAVVQSPQWTTC